MEEKTGVDYQELMEKTWILTCEDWMNIFKDWIGSQKATDSGILIKIPMDAGYVSLHKSADRLKLSLWLTEEITGPELKEIKSLR